MKKHLNDMPDEWHKEHRVTGLPYGEIDWCRDAGMALPNAPDQVQIDKAKEQLADLNLVGSMVSDLVISIHCLLADPSLSRNQVELCKRLEQILGRANEKMKEAGRIAAEYHLFKPVDNEDPS